MRIATNEITPQKFYKLVNIIKSVDEKKIDQLTTYVKVASESAEAIYKQARILQDAKRDLAQELKTTTKYKIDPFDSLEQQVNDMDKYLKHLSDPNFINASYLVVDAISNSYINLISLAKELKPKPLFLSDKFLSSDAKMTSFEDIQHVRFEIENNASTITKFINAVSILDDVGKKITDTTLFIYQVFEEYYKRLNHRHAIEGAKIHRDPVITDIAITVYKNIDSHGEISSGAKEDEVSAYTLRKAEILASALKEPSVHAFIQQPGSLFEFINKCIKNLHSSAENIKLLFANEIQEVKSLEDDVLWYSGFDYLAKLSNQKSFDKYLDMLSDVDPRNISFKEPNKLLSAEEKYNLKFIEDTTEEIVKILSSNDFNPGEIVKYVLSRKAELKDYFQNENSFYVCKIGSGNMFSGIAPGALEVIPGQKPNGNLDNIVGSGFDKVKTFMKNIESSVKWHNLFLATSPSKTTDKSNVLLVGPMGCGKSEVLRSVGADVNSIGVFAQGSDFNTCWKGEAEKNPKRLFEAAIKLHKDTKKHVHILIDEIDSILNNDRSYGDVNLSLEFQILMDGVVHYPNISVWGATNHPQRIPMPMIRRFSMVEIVGELDQADRVKLLKHYINFMPTNGFTDEAWNDAARDLEGATGDIIRKVADYLWRTKMSQFVLNKPNKAEELEKVLTVNGELKFDIKEFNKEKRSIFKNTLKQHVSINPDDLHKSVKLHLGNVAILTEIQTAKNTYSDAKKFLNQLNAEQIDSRS